MDRLPALIFLLTFVACTERPRRPTQATSRVDAVSAVPRKKANVEEFCDVHHASQDAPQFSWPALAKPPAALGNQWKWINVWATWCKPCVDEMPLLKKWRARLQGEGKAIKLQFLSVDETEDAVATFRREYPATPKTMRVSDPDKLGPWLVRLGLDRNAAIPIHVFVEGDKLRCVRTGALSHNHYEAVAALFSAR